ncbi:MAG: tRNA 2-thiouridine(34) synthase MnmA [Thiohalorhabdus sp.]|uniref:tRNA 2-thiouridine(34) synthase MnmA n=1 Tax=Thiohalorhabdus sp. TaxID=3094134 RepID=UPI0039808341
MSTAGAPSRVVVAMSGGVDSSVTAALLQEQGFDVIGVTMRLWDGPGNEGGCCSVDDADDARRVADRLGIPFYVLNYAEPFREKVVDNFVDEYLAGRTPNPCARCNQFIKFDRLLQQVRDLGADYLATGHYARIERDGERSRLRTGRDGDKDQSYFLAVTPAAELDSILFPVGGYDKHQVRELAARYELVTADKPESQDICFVSRSAAEFVASRGAGPGLEPGEIVDRAGNVLGEHRGAAYYTVGQRRGLHLAAGRPMYVVAVDTAANRVVVGEADEIFHAAMEVEGLNWFGDPLPEGGREAEVKVRYAGKPVAARVEPLAGDRARVTFAEPVRAVTPGQVAAFYSGDEVLGGGWIAEAAA